MNKQPYYHGVMFIFTATRAFTQEEVQQRLEKAFKGRDIVPGTVMVDEFNEPEPGDPADLM
jgi:hypothetical protein